MGVWRAVVGVGPRGRYPGNSPRCVAATRLGTTMRQASITTSWIVDLDRCEATHDPLGSHVGGGREHVLVRLGRDERFAFVARKREAHHGLVAGEREVHDSTDTELHPIAHQRFVAARKAECQRPHVVDGRHRGAIVRGSGGPQPRNCGANPEGRLAPVVGTPNPRRVLTKGQRTRERLLRAAIERFGTEGFRSTAVSQLSRDAGLTPAAAYAYFVDKEAFWAAAIEVDLDDLDAEIRLKALSSDRPLLELMNGLVAGLARHPLARRVMEEGTPEDLLLVLGHKLFSGTTKVIADRLRVRQAAGVLPTGSEPDKLAMGIETVMFSMVLSVVRADLDKNPERLWSVVEVLRAAAGGPPSPTEVVARSGSSVRT